VREEQRAVLLEHERRRERRVLALLLRSCGRRRRVRGELRPMLVALGEHVAHPCRAHHHAWDHAGGRCAAARTRVRLARLSPRRVVRV